MIANNLAVLVLALAAHCVLTAVPAFASGQIFDRTYPMPAGGSFSLENVTGSVQVEGWNRNAVEVCALKIARGNQADAAAVEVEVESRARQVAVRTRYPQGEGAEVAVEYHIHVPFRVLLGNIVTVNGNVAVHGVEGEGSLHSVNGDVEVLRSAGRFSAQTINGNVHLELTSLPDGLPMKVETVNGSVVLVLPRTARANLRVLNLNGEFSSELPVVSTAASTASRAFRVRLGSGGGEISVKTINGGIRLVRELDV